MRQSTGPVGAWAVNSGCGHYITPITGIPVRRRQRLRDKCAPAYMCRGGAPWTSTIFFPAIRFR